MFRQHLPSNLKRSALLALAALGIALNAVAEAPRLVVVYATCTVSAKFLGPYGGTMLTPNLDRLAASGAVFTAHRTESNLSGPSFASIFTGQQADGHGVFDHPAVIDPGVDDLSEILAAAGYDILYFDPHRMADHDLGYVQAAGHALDAIPYPAIPELQAALDRLAANPDARLAIFTAFSVTHAPYDRAVIDYFTMTNAYHPLGDMDPETIDRLYQLYREKRSGLVSSYPQIVEAARLSLLEQVDLWNLLDGLYRGNVQRLDALFGGLVQEIRNRNLWEETVCVFTADHGECINEPFSPFRWGHGGTVRSEIFTVPLIVAGPGVENRRHDFVTRSIDVAPTVAGLAGLEGSPQWQGVDLSPVLRGRAAPPRLTAFSRRAGFSDAGNPLVRPFKLIWAAVRDQNLVVQYRDFHSALEYRAYDVAADPDESLNILDLADPRHVQLVHALKCYRTRLANAYADAVEDIQIPEDAEESLRALGYIE